MVVHKTARTIRIEWKNETNKNELEKKKFMKFLFFLYIKLVLIGYNITETIQCVLYTILGIYIYAHTQISIKIFSLK